MKTYVPLMARKSLCAIKYEIPVRMCGNTHPMVIRDFSAHAREHAQWYKNAFSVPLAHGHELSQNNSHN